MLTADPLSAHCLLLIFVARKYSKRLGLRSEGARWAAPGSVKSSSSNENEDESGTIVNRDEQSASSNRLRESGGPGRTGRPKKHAFLNMVSENKAIRTM